MRKNDEEMLWRELRNQLVQTWNRVNGGDFEELERMHLLDRMPIHRHPAAVHDRRHAASPSHDPVRRR